MKAMRAVRFTITATALLLLLPSLTYPWEFAEDWRNISDLCDREQWRCPPARYPVCGSDNETYTNECELAQQQCEREQLTLVSRSACDQLDKKGTSNSSYPRAFDCKQDLDNYPCEEDCAPTCATNGRRFANMCSFALAHCYDKSLELSPEPCPRDPWRCVDDAPPSASWASPPAVPSSPSPKSSQSESGSDSESGGVIQNAVDSRSNGNSRSNLPAADSAAVSGALVAAAAGALALLLQL